MKADSKPASRKRLELGKTIVADSGICHGKPTFKGSRVMVWRVLRALPAPKFSCLMIGGIRALNSYKGEMRKPPVAPSNQRSENAVLDQAIQQLLGATKVEAKKKGKPLDRAQLRKEGYSERFIDKTEKA